MNPPAPILPNPRQYLKPTFFKTRTKTGVNTVWLQEAEEKNLAASKYTLLIWINYSVP
jgi:hypothetical protein